MKKYIEKCMIIISSICLKLFFCPTSIYLFNNLLFSRFNYATYYMICTNTQRAQEIFISFFFLSSLTCEKKDERNLLCDGPKKEFIEDDKSYFLSKKERRRRKLCQCISY